MLNLKLLFLGIFIFNICVNGQVKKINDVLMPAEYKVQEFNDGLSKNSATSIDTSQKFEIIKSDFLVNELAGPAGAEQNYVKIATDGTGNYVLAWIDYRNGHSEIFAQFYNNHNEKIGHNILVYDKPNIWNSQPHVAGNPNGGFIITWAQNSSQIVAQMFTTNGEKNGNPIILDTYQSNTNQPSIAINDKGYFIIQWIAEDYLYGSSTLYYKIFNSQGNAVTTDLQIDPAIHVTSVGWQNCAAADTNGNFVVVWSSRHDNRSGIFLQVLSSYGEKIGTSQLVSNNSDVRDHYFPVISSTDRGDYMILWGVENYRLQIKGGLAARLFNNDAGFITDQFTIMESDYYYSENYHIISDRKDHFTIVYYDNVWKYLVIGNDSQNLQQGNLNVTPPEPGYMRINGISFFNSSYNLALLYYNQNDNDLYTQKLSENFSTVSSVTKVNDDSESSWQTHPNVYFNNKGESIVLWEDLRDGEPDLYVQVYDKSNNPVGKNIRISETGGGRLNDVKSFSDGTFLIVFSSLESSPTIYFQKISPEGKLIGTNVKVKQNYESANVYLSINDQDQVFLCYYLYYLPVHTIYYSKFNKSLTPVASERVITTRKNGYSPYGFALSINKKFNILTTWINKKDATFQNDDEINGLIYNSEGKAITDTIVIKKVDKNIDYYTSNYLDDDDNYVVIITGSYRFYAKRFYNTNHVKTIETTYEADLYYNDVQITSFKNHKVMFSWKYGDKVIAAFVNDNNRINNTFILQTLEPRTTYFTDASNAYKTALYGDKLLFVYESRTNGGTGYDIWANVQKTEDINFDNEPFFPPVDDDVLYTNFPNPFNAQTKIVYEILAYHPVKLTVYDILGREVKVLVNENQEKGLYEVNFDASELASGIYFYRLDGFRTITKKMMVIK